MPLNDLIASGEADEPGSVTFWTRGKARDLTVHEKRPVWPRAEPVSCRLARQEIAEVAVALIDPTRIGEFKVRLRGAVRIRPGHEADLIRARALHGGIDLAICDALRSALNAWRGPGDFIGKLFPSGDKEASADAAAAVIRALRDIGLEVEAARIEPLGWNSDERIPLELGPRRVQCSGVGGSLSMTVYCELVPDTTQMAAFLTAKEASAGKASIKEAVEAHVFEWIETRYSRHQHAYEAQTIAAAMRAELDAFCGRRFGRKVAQLRYENGVVKVSAPEPEQFDFPASYRIAASNAEFKMTHRGTVVVSDVGRAPGGLAQRLKEAEDRIKTAIQSRILSFSANKVLAELHTFEGENANALSRWVIEDDRLGTELAARGLTLEHFYVFTNEALREPVPQGRTYRHVTPYRISGTDRTLTLDHNLFWRVGPTREQRSAYIEKGSLAPERFEEDFLGTELDAQTSRRLLDKTFDEIIFDYFRDQAKTEHELTEALQNELSASAAEFGVEVRNMTTVFEPLPEAKLLTGHTIDVAKAHYGLADSKDRIELGAKVKVRIPKDGDGSLLRQHFMGHDPQQIFATINGGIAEQIEFFLADVEPWEIFAMRGWQEGLERGAGLPLMARVKQHVATWLLATFGLEVVEPDGFKMPIGECALIDAAERLIGAEETVTIETDAHLERINSEFATDVRVKVGVTMPFRIDGVGSNPEDRRRFMEALRSMRGAEQTLDQIRVIVDQTVRGLMQSVPAGAFNSQNFAKYPFAEAFAAATIHEVRESVGLQIYVSARRVLPYVEGTLVARDVIRHRNVLDALEDLRAKAETRRDYDPDEVAGLTLRIDAKKREIEKVVGEQGVGGALDVKALLAAMEDVKAYMREHNIPSALLTDQSAGRPPAESAAGPDSHHEVAAEKEAIVDAEFKEIESEGPTQGHPGDGKASL